MNNPLLQITSSSDFPLWLQQEQISFAFTTYQTNRLFCVGINSEGRLAAHERLLDKPMGLYADGDRLYLSTRYQVWRFDNHLARSELQGSCDRLYIPRTAYTTGDLNVHDVVVDNAQNIIFVNSDFSCLATLSKDYSFVPIWQPPFISKLVAEDRCHLNGLAMKDGLLAYVTACSTSDTAAGWRNHRVNGGVVINVQNNEIIATGLSMPHSPRWYQGKLWLLNSGTGELGYIEDKKFVPITFCPGFVRGLAFWGNVALVGLSKLRARTFTGLALEERLAKEGKTPQCGLMAIDLNTGELLHWVHLEGIVEELFDVVVLPGVRRPQTMGLQNDDIQRLVTFPGSGGIVITKPTAQRPSLGKTAPVAGLPSEPHPLHRPLTPSYEEGETIRNQIKYQRVYHLTPSNALAYDDLTFPRLSQRWQNQPQRGELIGLSASITGEIVGFAIAEILPNGIAELISLLVLPPYQRHGIGKRLVYALELELAKNECNTIQMIYQINDLTNIALDPLLQKLNWQLRPLNETVQTALKFLNV
ncbi:TIGR03032 family protein [Aphanothece hegewaldii CCALA 016]|uniref:TIGR03032 family protein n=1 Tax=Aphanothece hegewaldii CCALA 016 TaxID=2107694 RepID=A0A2T1LSX1_9CHRO|nr:TIGR03032 family protein [Aphanothece hegewaldii]PSF33178.1 TIGR03032 family protein [Aphanothece hegewaldii CCALA 016]